MKQTTTRRVVTMLAVMMLTAMTAWAQGYNYIDANGTTHNTADDGITVSADGNTYTIHTAAGWNIFCDLLANNAKGYFDGKTVKLANDISVTRMAGSNSLDFTGTFDGNSKTLTVNYSATEDCAAPFRYVEDGCVIKNLIVEGTITTSKQFAAGIAGKQYGTVSIRNCRVGVTINSSVEGDGTHGGLVAVKGDSESAKLTIEGCVFDGKIVSTGPTATTKCGGFVGYKKDKGTLTIKNCLYAPKSDANAVTDGATFARNGGTITNCYYTATLGTAQGKATRTITAGANVTIMEIAPNGSYTTPYNVSGITPITNGGIMLESGNTAKFYYGSGDIVNILLTNNRTGAPDGYRYTYSFSGGTATPTNYFAAANSTKYALTMPDDNVTVSVDTDVLRSTGLLVIINYIDADGKLRDTPVAIAIDGTENNLGRSDQETWYFVGADISHDGDIIFQGDVNIILADGCTMTASNNEYRTSGSGGTLTFYGQTLGTGTLNVSSTSNRYAINHKGRIVINGGKVTATNTNDTAIWVDGDITINGGTVTATGYTFGIKVKGDITINGGKVTATNTIDGDALGFLSTGGTITLGWTNADDFIYANGYYAQKGTVTLADAFIDEDGTLHTSSNVGTIAGKTLRPIEVVTLAKEGYGTFYDSRVNVKLPAGVKANVVTNYAGLTLDYETIADGDDTSNNVVPKGTAVMLQGPVTDGGTEYRLTPVTTDATPVTSNMLDGSDTQRLTIGDGKHYKLSYDKDGKNVGWYWGADSGAAFTSAAHKAWLVLPYTAAPSFLGLPDDNATGVAVMDNGKWIMDNEAGAWYTLDGRKIANGQKPKAKGLYIVNGRKVVIK